MAERGGFAPMPVFTDNIINYITAFYLYFSLLAFLYQK